MILGAMFIALIMMIAYIIFFDNDQIYDDESEIYNYEIVRLDWDEDTGYWMQDGKPYRPPDPPDIGGIVKKGI